MCSIYGTGTGTGRDVCETPRDLFGYLDGVGGGRHVAGSVRFGLVRNGIALRGVWFSFFWVVFFGFVFFGFDQVDMVERDGRERGAAATTVFCEII